MEEVLVPVNGYRFLLDLRVLKPERFLTRECSRKVSVFFKVSKSTQIGACELYWAKSDWYYSSNGLSKMS